MMIKVFCLPIFFVLGSGVCYGMDDKGFRQANREELLPMLGWQKKFNDSVQALAFNDHQKYPIVAVACSDNAVQVLNNAGKTLVSYCLSNPCSATKFTHNSRLLAAGTMVAADERSEISCFDLEN